VSSTSTRRQTPQSETVARFKQLQPRPNGLPRAEVVAHQRRRIHAATIEAMTDSGQAKVSVAKIVRLAGVSKRTFYEQFDNKDVCVEATFREAVDFAFERFMTVLEAHPEREAGIRAAFEALVRLAAQRPSAAVFVLGGAGPADGRTAQRVASARSDFGHLITSSFGTGPDGQRLQAPVAMCIGYGVERVLRTRSLNAMGWPSLGTEATGLGDWALSYRWVSDDALVMQTHEFRGLRTPPQRADSRPTSARMRLLRSVVELAAGAPNVSGSLRLSSDAVARRAGVSRHLFDARYASVHECLLDAMGVFVLEALVETGSVLGDRPGPVEVYRAIQALLARIALDPKLRAVATLSSTSADPAVTERGKRLIGAYVDLFTRGLRTPSPATALKIEATAGAVWGLVSHHICRSGLDALSTLSPLAGFLTMAPFIGARGAADAITNETRTGGMVRRAA
jgi:AcrR family transcriptional regulator